ncbi:MAG: hypothetical protein KA764_10615 [Anaerolineales bacterium]|nr:hypothetical protein [Anaerolineales bacterium]
MNITRLDPLGLNTYPALEGASAAPVIVFFGDSRAADWPAPALAHGTVINRGIGAQTTAQVLGRFQAHVAPLKPQVVVIQAGINDLKTIPLFPEQKAAIIQACQDNLRQIVALALNTGARVVVTTIFPLGALPLERRLFWSDDVAAAIAEVNAYLATLAGERVTVLDTGAVLVNSEGSVDPQYSRDFLHLNPAGYAALNQAIAGLIEP